MAKKYLSLKAAAKRLEITPDELARAREDGGIRGFANRGSWKFREEDIDEFARRREADSSPEIPLEAENEDAMDSSDSDVQLYSKTSLFDEDDLADLTASDSDVRLSGDSGPLLEGDDSSATGQSVLDFDGDSDQSLNDSDSDVKLVEPGTDPDINLADVAPGGTAPGMSTDADITLAASLFDEDDDDDDSDSDVKLAKGDTDEDSDIVLSDSDSDIRLESGDDESDSDSDVNLVGGTESGDDSDSDVKLSALDTASDIHLMAHKKSDKGSDAAATLALPDDSDLKLVEQLQDDDDDDPDSGITIATTDDDSGISLEIDDSGISLEADDSGISLEGVDSSFAGDSGLSIGSDDSGISLDSGDSGISLDTDDDSGISLDTDDDSGITMDPNPGSTIAVKGLSSAKDSSADTLQMDLEGADLGLNESADAFATGEFDLGLLEGKEDDTGTDTSILMFDDDSQSADTDMEFPSVEADFGDEEAFDDDEFGDDFAGDFDDDEIDDVFEAEDEDEFDAGESQVGFKAPAGAVMRSREAPWGAAVTTGVALGSAFSAVGAFAGFELVRTMWLSFQPGGSEFGFLLFIGGLFG